MSLEQYEKSERYTEDHHSRAQGSIRINTLIEKWPEMFISHSKCHCWGPQPLLPEPKKEKYNHKLVLAAEITTTLYMVLCNSVLNGIEHNFTDGCSLFNCCAALHDFLRDIYETLISLQIS